MLNFMRKYSTLLLVTLMGLFVLALTADAWHDVKVAKQDMVIETVVELEADDFDWDENDNLMVTGD